jgi:dihydroflavonol-4-reductase
MAARAAGRPAPRVRLPIAPLVPLALACEAVARLGAGLGVGVEPLVTREMLAMARKKMFFSSAKARAELGYAPRAASDAIRDAVAWFAAAGARPGRPA